jgi:hypothetical protein
VARPEPTDDELRAAWARSRRADWPATFEEVMADALLSRMVRINAMHPPRAQRKPPEPPRQQPLLPARGGTKGFLTHPDRRVRPIEVDRKRAASGDRDED